MLDFDTLALAPAMAAFGESATLLPKAGGAPVPFVGSFSAAFTEEKVDRDGNLVSTTRPAIGTQASQFAGLGVPWPKQGDQVLLSSGVTYAVIDVRPDGIAHLHVLMQISRPAA